MNFEYLPIDYNRSVDLSRCGSIFICLVIIIYPYSQPCPQRVLLKDPVAIECDFEGSRSRFEFWLNHVSYLWLESGHTKKNVK